MTHYSGDTRGTLSITTSGKTQNHQKPDELSREVAFIDPGIPELNTFLGGLRPDLEVILLSSKSSAPVQIAKVLHGHSQMVAIHIVAHGDPGVVGFSSGALTIETLNEHAPELAGIGDALAPEGALLLWSCKTGSGARGATFIDALEHVTGASIEAATDLVGSAAKGGSWKLNSRKTGHLAPLEAKAAAAYTGILSQDFKVDLNTTTDGTGDATTYLEQSENVALLGNATIQADTLNWIGQIVITIDSPNTTETLDLLIDVPDGMDVIHNENGPGSLTLRWTNNSALPPSTEEWTNILNSVIYSDPTNHDPAATRSYTVSVLEGSLFSTEERVVTGNINITPVNDAPTANFVSFNYGGSANALGQGNNLDLTGSFFVGDVDANAGILTVGLTVTDGALSATSGTSGVGLSGGGSALTITGTLTQINAFLSGSGSTLGFTPSSNSPSAVTLAMIVHDNGSTGGGDLSASVSSTINIAPRTLITNFTTDTGTVGDHLTMDHSLVLIGTGGANTTVEVFKDGASIGTTTVDAGGNWSFGSTGTTLGDGTYNFTAKAIDAAGNSSGPSPAFTIRVDSAVPSAPVITDFSTDTGTLGDHITNDQTLVLNGTAEADSTVEVFKNGVSIGTTPVDGTGSWSLDHTGTTLVGGTYTFTAKATDEAGNISDTSTAFAIRVDSNTDPLISSNGGGATAKVAVAENSTTVTTVTAADPDPGQTLSYSIMPVGAGGVANADAAKFAINATTGALAFLAAPDFEHPNDVGTNNVYNVTVQVSDGNGGLDTQALAVAVTNVSPEAVTGDTGDNIFLAQADREIFSGLAGSDTVSYELAHSGLTANLAAPKGNTGDAAGDTYNSIENLRGSPFGDKLTGDANDNVLEGGAGKDQLDGGRGGMDTASYEHAASGVTADLSNLKSNIGDAAGDTYSGIENLMGSEFNDTLTGDRGANKLIGGLGTDVLKGGAGNDTFVFRTLQETTSAAPDRITDFAKGDKIDLSAIDADTGAPGDQAFHIGGGGGHAGDIVATFAKATNLTTVDLYVNNDATVDATLQLTGDHHNLTLGDFVA
ncbi:MAG TPA: DUF4347 domain-containing protein [Verrucomicrobiae bacterium]|nr:DUF4347 domain-containing protein [Verrucomicrobiae bacterium]